MTTLSLELSKELQSVCKEKNIEMHESYLYWWKDCQEAHKGFPPVFEISHEQPDHGWQPIAPACTLCELLAWLPSKMKDRYATYILQVTKIDDGYDVGYNKDYADSPAFATYCDLTNPCDACGKLLIWLIKEGLI